MQAVFVQQGSRIDYETSSTPVSAGDVVVVGERALVASIDIPANSLGALATDGVFSVVKDDSDISAGDTIYWDAAGDPVGGTAGSGAATLGEENPVLGWAIADAGVSATSVSVKIAQCVCPPADGGGGE